MPVGFWETTSEPRFMWETTRNFLGAMDNQDELDDDDDDDDGDGNDDDDDDGDVGERVETVALLE